MPTEANRWRPVRTLSRRVREGLGMAGVQHELQEVRKEIDRVSAELDYVRHVAETTRNSTHLLTRRLPVGAHRPCLLFLIHNMEAWYSLRGVLAAVRREDLVETVVASLGRRFPGAERVSGEDDVSEGLAREGVPHLRFRDEDSFIDLATVKAIDPAVIVRQSQWDADLPAAFAVRELDFAELALVPYEPMNLVDNPHGPGDRVVGHDSDLHRACSAVFCANDLVASVAERLIHSARPGNMVITGHPKGDELRKHLTVGPRAGGQPPRVLISLHHSVGTDWDRFGTFPDTAPHLVQWARSRPEWSFEFSAHPALADRLALESDEVRSVAADFDAAWDGLANTSRTEPGPYLAAFEGADLLITDGLSWLLEFQATGRPVIFIERSDHRPFHEVGQRVREGVYPFPDAPTAIACAEDFLTGQAEHSLGPTQREIVAELFGDAGAADRIAAHLVGLALGRQRAD